jgi:hypothetical protein
MLQSDRFDQVHMNYTSSRAAPNEAYQISPNLYEARNLQLAIAGNRPVCPFGAIRPRKSGLTVPQSPNVTGHALEHESDIAKPLDLLRVLGPCGGKSIIFRPRQEVRRRIQQSRVRQRSRRPVLDASAGIGAE